MFEFELIILIHINIARQDVSPMEIKIHNEFHGKRPTFWRSYTDLPDFTARGKVIPAGAHGLHLALVND